MMDREEFMSAFEEALREYSEKEKEKFYQLYLEDPLQFTEGMIDKQNL